jgi:aminoglycoside 3-N-acetyltransferase I
MQHVPAVTIRHLSPSDVALARELMATFGEAFEDPDAYTGAPPSDAHLAELLGSAHFIALAALQDERVVAGLTAYELKKPERERSEIYIYDLAVKAELRRRGIATALITQLKGLAKARAAYVIFVQADYVDPPAIALYTKLGAREDVLHFDIDVN